MWAAFALNSSLGIVRGFLFAATERRGAMNYCMDCDWLKVVDAGIELRHVCVHPELLDPVTASPRPAAEMRMHFHNCGPSGLMFNQKVAG